jgi:hypothetical protein
MLWDLKIYYIYVNSHINFKLNKNIVKFKITTLLYSFGDYMILMFKDI